MRHVVITTQQTESENPNPDGCSLRQLSQEGRNVRIERQTIYTGLPVAALPSSKAWQENKKYVEYTEYDAV